jgi:hypothetical protein
MNREIFKSERYFIVFDYLVSHGQLLLRSDKRKGYQKNIDIIFFDTTFVQMFTMLYGITISIVDNLKTINYKSVNNYLNQEENVLFEIISGEEKYYIAASFVKVFENELEFNETSLGLEHKGQMNIIAQSRKIGG